MLGGIFVLPSPVITTVISLSPSFSIFFRPYPCTLHSPPVPLLPAFQQFLVFLLLLLYLTPFVHRTLDTQCRNAYGGCVLPSRLLLFLLRLLRGYFAPDDLFDTLIVSF